MKNQKSFKETVKLIEKAWSQNTIYPGLLFDEQNPAIGQCEPTVCLIQDLFGGDIYKIENSPSIAPKKTHYYNKIDGVFYDLTKNQFSKKVCYDDGVCLDDKQSSTLRKTSYCNRKVRYICLVRDFNKLLENKQNINVTNCESVTSFFLGAIKALMQSPWEEIVKWFPELFKLIIFIMDCRQGSVTEDVMNDDSLRVVEHYLEGYYEEDCDNLLDGWERRIVDANGRTFAEWQNKTK